MSAIVPCEVQGVTMFGDDPQWPEELWGFVFVPNAGSLDSLPSTKTPKQMVCPKGKLASQLSCGFGFAWMGTQLSFIIHEWLADMSRIGPIPMALQMHVFRTSRPSTPKIT